MYNITRCWEIEIRQNQNPSIPHISFYFWPSCGTLLRDSGVRDGKYMSDPSPPLPLPQSNLWEDNSNKLKQEVLHCPSLVRNGFVCSQLVVNSSTGLVALGHALKKNVGRKSLVTTNTVWLSNHRHFTALHHRAGRRKRGWTCQMSVETGHS